MTDYFGIWIFCSLNFSDQEHSKYEVKGGWGGGGGGGGSKKKK